jgi:two-component system response regulator HydG
MPGLDGMELLKAARALHPEAEVILMTAFGTVEKAVEAMRLGAYDFVTKPIKRDVLLKSARLALERQALLAENRALRAQLAGFKTERSIIGSSPALREVMELVKQAAPTRATVLLTGESGTGKELFARALHELSERRDRAFVAVNCAALPESLLEAELFGTEKGAFTGSTARAGRFEAADGGTLFLDEIGEIPLSVQVKLLRVLQEEEITRLGSNAGRRVDVRLIAATNKDLEDEVRAGRFRQDLYYRLHVIALHLPPLRARPDDISLLAAHFLRRYAERNGRVIGGITRAALDALLGWMWPGNVRELENTIERAVVLDKDGVLDVDDLPHRITHAPAGGEDRAITIPLGVPLEEVERRVIQETLRMTGGNKRLTSQLLGIATRTLYRKIE